MTWDIHKAQWIQYIYLMYKHINYLIHPQHMYIHMNWQEYLLGNVSIIQSFDNVRVQWPSLGCAAHIISYNIISSAYIYAPSPECNLWGWVCMYINVYTVRCYGNEIERRKRWWWWWWWSLWRGCVIVTYRPIIYIAQFELLDGIVCLYVYGY